MSDVEPPADINDLPDEVLEYMLSLLSPYRDFKNVMLVCHRWYAIMKDVREHEFQHFREAVCEGGLWWTPHPPAPGPTITERYSHSACYLDKCLYIFGGCTSNNTTFNDLWKLDLGTGEWIRPLAMGSYPSPKAYASLVVHRDHLVLFGGWSHPTPLSLHQSPRFFLQLHTYAPESNNWEEIVTILSPQGLAGHGATVIEDVMVVFGGCTNNGVSCNDVWVLDLIDYDWTMKNPAGNKPLPRYGHAQIQIDNSHILVVGGCGGPNMQFTDTWLLSMDEEVWRWDDVTILHPENCAPQIWCHPACKVGDKMVVLSKIPRASGTLSPNSLPQFRDPPTSITGSNYQTVANRRVEETSSSAQGHCLCCQQVALVDKMSIRAKRSHPETSESSSQDSSSDNDDSGSNRFGGRGGRNQRGLGGGTSGRKPGLLSGSGRTCMGPPASNKVLQPQPCSSESGLFKAPAALEQSDSAPISHSEFSQTYQGGLAGPSQSGLAGPSQSGLAGPSQSGLAGPSQSGLAGPSQSGLAGPSQSGLAGPSQGGLAGPSQSGLAGPSQSGLAGPSQSGLAGPSQSGLAGPSQGGLAGPSQGGLAGPSQSGLAGPSQSGLAGPSQSGLAGSSQGGLAGSSQGGLAGPSQGGLAGPSQNALGGLSLTAQSHVHESSSSAPPGGDPTGVIRNDGLMSPPTWPTASSRPTSSSPPGGRSGLPSVRPNAMRNRQKQLEMLKRYEDRIKGQKAKESSLNNHNTSSCCHGSSGPCKLLFPHQKKVLHPMYVHCLDLSQVAATRTATWLPLTEYGAGKAPDETLFYSLVEGRGELIMFGGIQTDVNNMRRPMQSGHVVSNMVYFLDPKKLLR